MGSMEDVIRRSLDARDYFAEQVEANSLRRKEFNLQVTSALSSPPGSPTFIEEQQHNPTVSKSAARATASRRLPSRSPAGKNSQVGTQCLCTVAWQSLW